MVLDQAAPARRPQRHRIGNEEMASLRLGIAASLKEASGPTAGGRQDEARPTASLATQQKRRRKAAHAATPPQGSKRGRLGDGEEPKPASPCERDGKLSVTVGEHVDALWPADGEYYPARIRAVNADGTISLGAERLPQGLKKKKKRKKRLHRLRHRCSDLEVSEPRPALNLLKLLCLLRDFGQEYLKRRCMRCRRVHTSTTYPKRTPGDLRATNRQVSFAADVMAGPSILRN